MEIKINIAERDVVNLSEKQYAAYAEELRVRVHEVYPESQLLIARYGEDTGFTAEGFHDNEKVCIVVHELQQDVFLHGYWRDQEQ